jgi:hypothetical protein
VLLAVAGGFALGARSVSEGPDEAIAQTQQRTAPAPTRVVQLETGVNWKEARPGEGGE